ncbi:hypothetical protein IP88_03360 [alpha proteobacterium AAP81b]|nr:hypothetical protein IP88_03360 [alpha proteobacterium AAP81b]
MASVPATISRDIVDIAASRGVADDDLGGDRRLAWWIGGAFFIGFLGWAALTPLDAGAYASGAVAVAGSTQAVQHKEGGVVAAIHVKEGQRVVQGQPLITISRDTIVATERGLTRETLMLLAERQRLLAERAGLATIAAPPEFAGLTGEDADIAREAMRAQTALMTARRATLAQQKQVLAQQAAQASARIAGYQAELAANAEQRKSIDAQLEGMRELAAKGFASKNNVRQLERASASLQGDVGSSAGKIAEAREAVGQARMQTLVLQSNMVEEADQRLREVATRLNEVLPQRASATERLSQTIVRSPATGRVVGKTVTTVGGVVAPGQLLMNVVPEHRELVVQAHFSPDDADDIAPGMLTEVRFPSLRDANLPTIDGELVTVSADAMQDQKTGASYFTGEIHVPAAALRRIEAARPGRPPIGSGLPVEVLVKLQKRTVLSYLIEPLMRATWHTGREH